MFLFHICMLCRASCRGVLCAPCRRDVEELAIAAGCPRCGLPMRHNASCGKCLKHPPAFDQTVAALRYTQPLTQLVQDFKFRGQSQLAKFFARHLNPPAADMLLPVPLFAAREQWRGFNQARELARHLPKLPPLHCDVLSRQADTPPQANMESAAARRRNVQGAFVVHQPVEGKTIAVLDDVMTTGATLNEIAKTLKKAGAAAVINIVIARAPS